MVRLVRKGKHILRPDQILRMLGYAPEDEVEIAFMQVNTDPPLLTIGLSGPMMPVTHQSAEAPIVRLPTKKEDQ